MLTANQIQQMAVLLCRWVCINILNSISSLKIRGKTLLIVLPEVKPDDWPIGLAKFAVIMTLGFTLLLPLTGFSEEMNAASSVSGDSADNPASAVGAASSVSADSSPEYTLNSMDPTRNYMSDKLESWARSVDSFFGDYRNYQESNDSVVQLDATQIIGYLGEPKHDFALNIKVSLPNTEKKMKFLIETNPEDKTTSNTTYTQTRTVKDASTPASIAAALRYEKTESERWHFSTDGGIQLAGLASTPFVRARLSLAMPLDKWRMKVAESVFWFSTIGAGESTLIDFERQLNEQQLFRISSNATWLNNSQNFDLSQSFSVFHTFNERTALLYQMSAFGVSRPQAQVTDYVILLTYRYRLHRKWVFLEVSPQLHFPEAVNYQASALLSMRLEFLLDNSR